MAVSFEGKTALVANIDHGDGTGVIDEEAEFDSPETVEAIAASLRKSGLDVTVIEAGRDLPEKLKAEDIRFVFNIAEGRGGRDREAQVPALLSLLDIPYSGSDALVMSLTLDKAMCKRFAMSFGVRTSPFCLVSPGHENDIVSSKELELCPGDMHDPLNEGGSSVTPHIVHRYPDRVLLLVTTQCAMYCRHCTRRRIVGERDCSPTIEELDKELDYIRAHKEVRDVLISGGDPLTLPTDRLEAIIKRLREIEHVDIIRIGTRVPCVLPMRIDDELVSMLKKYHPLWMNIQFNHVRELTPESEEACRKLADAGIPLGNQSVLLNGINDDAETMKALLLRLVHNRIRPYYLYQCDLAEGIGHFRTTVDKGIDIIHQLQGRISGFAVPKYVIDAPGGGGKVPINYEYVKEVDGNKIVFENYEGGLYSYLQPGGEKNDG